MNVLLINNDKGWGGGQEHLKDLIPHLESHGYCTHLLCRKGSKSETTFGKLGYRLTAVSDRKRGLWRSISQTASLLRRELFDVIMVTREHDLAVTYLAWKMAFPFCRRGRFIMCYHTATSRKQPFLNRVDAVVCISNYVLERLLSAHPALKPPVTVISNGIRIDNSISPEKFTSDRKRRFFFGCGFPLIGMVGAFFKNQIELMEVVSIVKKRFPTVTVALVGDDTDPGLTGPIVEKAEFFGVKENLIMTGKVAHDRLADLYYDFDLTVSTFRNEGFGLIHLESLACGTPVIAYNEGGQVDIFKGSDVGILVEGGADSFAVAVTESLVDEDRRYVMGRCGVDLVRSCFTVAVMSESYMKLFVTLCRGKM